MNLSQHLPEHHIFMRLTEAEMRMCEYFGRMRYRINREQGTVDQQISDDDPELQDIYAFAAELMFCKLVNTMPDFSVEPRSGSFDTILANGRSVDVKHTIHENGVLLCNPTKADKPKADIYVLVRGTPPNLHYAGWATGDELFAEKRMFNGRMNYWLEPEKIDRPIPCGPLKTPSRLHIDMDAILDFAARERQRSVTAAHLVEVSAYTLRALVDCRIVEGARGSAAIALSEMTSCVS